MDEAYDRNLQRARRMALLAVIPPTLLMLVLVVVASALAGTPLLLLVLLLPLALGAYGIYRGAQISPSSVAMAATGAHPAKEDEHPRLHNLVEGLCVGIGLPTPTLWVVEDESVNALSIARSLDSAAVVVTRGLLERLTLVEQEAVLAHELARIRRGESVVGTAATVLLGGKSGLVPAPGRRPYGTIFNHWPSVLSAPFVRAVAARGEIDDDGWSDLVAVEITRYPPGLAAALEKAQGGPERVAAASPAIDHLWLVGPEATGPFGEALRHVYEVRRPLADRIEMLQEL